MTRHETRSNDPHVGPSNKRRSDQRSPSPRPKSEAKLQCIRGDQGEVNGRVKATNHATDAALKRLFAFSDTDNQDSDLDQVLAWACDDDLIRSALRRAGTRITRWTVDKNAEYHEEPKRQQVVARLKERWITNLLPMLVECWDGDFHFSSHQQSFTAWEKEERYQIELSMTRIVRIDDSDDSDESLDEPYEPPSVVSAALPRATLHREAHEAAAENARLGTLPSATSGHEASDRWPNRDERSSLQVHDRHRSSAALLVRLAGGSHFLRFGMSHLSTTTCTFRLPKGPKQTADDRKCDVDRAIRRAIEGKVAEHHFIDAKEYYAMNGTCASRRLSNPFPPSCSEQLPIWIARFTNVNAAARATGIVVPATGTQFTLEAHNPHPSTVLVAIQRRQSKSASHSLKTRARGKGECQMDELDLRWE